MRFYNTIFTFNENIGWIAPETGVILFGLFHRAKASGADIAFYGVAVGVDGIDFLDVGRPGPSGFDMAMTYAVSGHSAFAAYNAYFRHVDLPIILSVLSYYIWYRALCQRKFTNPIKIIAQKLRRRRLAAVAE